jgi:hypothetical protein
MASLRASRIRNRPIFPGVSDYQNIFIVEFMPANVSPLPNLLLESITKHTFLHRSATSLEACSWLRMYRLHNRVILEGEH